MDKSSQQLKNELIEEVLGSKMTLNRKLKVLHLLDTAFRKYLGIIYLTDEELEENDILNRSM